MSLKTWTKRFVDYDAGAPISKALINALATVVRSGGPFKDVAMQSLATRKVDYERVWNKTAGWAITPEQTAQGLTWLARRPIQKLMTEQDKAVLENFSHFTFVGFEIVDRTTHSAFPRIDARPVYRVHSSRGNWFDYSSSPWQRSAYDQPASAPFSILSRGKK